MITLVCWSLLSHDDSKWNGCHPLFDLSWSDKHSISVLKVSFKPCLLSLNWALLISPCPYHGSQEYRKTVKKFLMAWNDNHLFAPNSTGQNFGQGPAGMVSFLPCIVLIELTCVLQVGWSWLVLPGLRHVTAAWGCPSRALVFLLMHKLLLSFCLHCICWWTLGQIKS